MMKSETIWIGVWRSSGHISFIWGAYKSLEDGRGALSKVIGHDVEWEYDEDTTTWQVVTELPGIIFIDLTEYELGDSEIIDLIKDDMEKAMRVEERRLRNPWRDFLE